MSTPAINYYQAPTVAQRNRPIYGLIYLATNLVNGKKYVGSTFVSVLSRQRQHVRSKMPFGVTVRKYGIDGFSWRVIDTAVTIDMLNRKEVEHIAFHDCRIPKGYNVAQGGLGSGHALPATIEKLRLAAKRYQAETGQLKRVRKTVNESRRIRRMREYFAAHRPEMQAKMKDTLARFPNMCRDNGLIQGRKMAESGEFLRIRELAFLPENAAKREAAKKAFREANPDFWRNNGRRSGLINVETGHIVRLNHVVHHERKGRVNPKCRFCINVHASN